MFTVKEIVSICGGTLFCGDENVLCDHFTNDTRTLKKGDTYIGIKGEKFDGNLFYQDAFLKGANCVILEKNTPVKETDKPIILVDNGILALQALASFLRARIDKIVVGITGSVGKTSTKDLIYSVLSKKYNTLKTTGNYNNHIGLPLTILKYKNEDAIVIEMGMNHLKEISVLSNILKPTIGVITNIGTAHIGNLGSRENILKAKLEILDGMDKNSILIVNNDNDLLNKYVKENKHVHTIGIENKSDFMATNIKYYSSYSVFDIEYLNKKYQVKCPVPGKSFIYNALVSFAVGVYANIPIEKIIEGIASFSLTEKRLEIINSKKGYIILNDAYNASLDSMASSLEIFSKIDAKRHIAVLGSMLELGDYSKTLHEQVGDIVIKNKIDYLITIGDEAKNISKRCEELTKDNSWIKHFDNLEEVSTFLKSFLKKEDALLLKASNSIKLYTLVEHLK